MLCESRNIPSLFFRFHTHSNRAESVVGYLGVERNLVSPLPTNHAGYPDSGNEGRDVVNQISYLAISATDVEGGESVSPRKAKIYVDARCPTLL